MMVNRFRIGQVTAVVLVAALSTLVHAHAKLEKTVPADAAVLTAPPTSVTLSFSEAPDAKVSTMEIKGPSALTKLVTVHVMGKSLMGMVQGDMPDGPYSVEWQTSGDDGHLQKGVLSFTLKRK